MNNLEFLEAAFAVAFIVTQLFLAAYELGRKSRVHRIEARRAIELEFLRSAIRPRRVRNPCRN